MPISCGKVPYSIIITPRKPNVNPRKRNFSFSGKIYRKHPRAVLRGAGVLVSSKSDCSVRKFVITGRMLRGRHRLAFPHEHRIQRLTVLVDHFISACSGTNVPAVQWIVHIFYLRGRQTCDHCQYAHPSALYAPRLNLPPDRRSHDSAAARAGKQTACAQASRLRRSLYLFLYSLTQVSLLYFPRI